MTTAQHETGHWLELPEAASRLSLTQEALRMRVRRKQVSAKKIGHRWFVFCYEQNGVAQADRATERDSPEAGSPATQHTTQAPEQNTDRSYRNATEHTALAVYAAFVDSLKGENAHLKELLATRDEELRRRDEELARSQTVLLALSQQLPRLLGPHEASSMHTVTVAPSASPPWWLRLAFWR